MSGCVVKRYSKDSEDSKMKEGFIAHWCKSRKGASTWRPYNTVLCSCCLGEEHGSINMTFEDRQAYEKVVKRDTDILDDGWRN